MEVQTIQRYIHSSPRKLRLVADMVRKMAPVSALRILRITPKYAAKDLSKAIETVLANAKQQGIDENVLSFKKLEVDESVRKLSIVFFGHFIRIAIKLHINILR